MTRDEFEMQGMTYEDMCDFADFLIGDANRKDEQEEEKE